MLLQWSDFKSIVNSKALSIQWIELSTMYRLAIYDGMLGYECRLEKNPSDSTDLNDFENNYKAKGNKPLVTKNSPFGEKVLPNGKKVFTRIHGMSGTVAGAPDNLDFVIPYASCKLTGIQIINCELGDKVNMKVLDTPSGTISGTPNLVLNQFAFDVNMTKDFYEYKSSYDADLIQDMKVRIEFDAITSDLLPKTIYVNFLLHQVTD